MRWRGRRGSSNIDDRRGARMGGGGVVLGGGGLLVVIVLSLVFGVDPTALLQQVGTRTPVETPSGPGIDDEAKQFVSVILADTEDVWRGIFRSMNRTYADPELVMFSGRVRSACGIAGSATGPFYCPADRKVYIDLSFYDDLKNRFNAPGDFAQAYVIAHEVGHHVQHLLGITDMVHDQRGRLSEAEYNRLSVRLELQADFFAGVWAHHAERMWGILEPGDVEEALNAASAIGDDRLQQEAQGHVVPDSFTHGTSAQRARWFRRGLETGDVSQGDTFATDDL